MVDEQQLVIPHDERQRAIPHDEQQLVVQMGDTLQDDMIQIT